MSNPILQGAFTYGVTTAGTITVPAGATVKKIWAVGAANATVAIGSGSAIPVPNGTAPFWEDFDSPSCAGTLVAPSAGLAVVFTNTVAGYVSWYK